MYNFDPYSVLLAIATDIAVLLMTGFVLQGHMLAMFSAPPVFLIRRRMERTLAPGTRPGRRRRAPTARTGSSSAHTHLRPDDIRV